MEVQFKVFSWDWKEQPDWDDINKFLDDFRSTPYFHTVDTGSDCYAVLIANKRLPPIEVELLYEE